MCLNVETLISFFDTYVARKVKYGVATMQIMQERFIQKMSNPFQMLENTNTASVYFETGKLPFKTVRFFRMLEFGYKVLCS